MNRLLIVDDAADFLETMLYVLTTRGYAVKVLTTPADIFKEISSFQPDLLILDIIFPNADGRDICREVREREETKDLKILACSAFPQVLEDYESYCATDVLAKPFDLTILLEKITNLTMSIGKLPSS